MEVIEEWEKVKEAFSELAQEVTEKMETLIELFESMDDQHDEYLEWEKQREKMRSTWRVPADTRLRSQVVNNKPRNFVRKVI